MNHNIFSEKKDWNFKLKEKYFLSKTNKAIWLIKITNKNLIVELRDAFLALPANFVIENEEISQTEKLWKNIVATKKVPENLLLWFDFLICDDDICTLNRYLEKWIAPIIPKKNHFNSIFKEFNPAKSEGNSFLYDSENKWQIFYSLVRYLENYKFSFDNKNLVKNILDI